MRPHEIFLVGKLRFDWDRAKAKTNLQKHKVSFEEGATIFVDDNAILLDDPDQFDDEVRFVMVGYSIRGRLLAVVHVERGYIIGIARLATRSERKSYEEKGQS